MTQDEPLCMDWQTSLERVKALLLAITQLADDIQDGERVEAIVCLAELAHDIAHDQLIYTLREEEKEQRAAKRKKNTSRVSVGVERNHHGPDEQTME
jgi:hypothetical protein